MYNTFYRDIFYCTITPDGNFMPNGLGYTPFGDAIRSSFVMSDFNLLTVSQLTIALLI